MASTQALTSLLPIQRRPYTNKILDTLPGNLVAYYPLDEKTGTTATDWKSTLDATYYADVSAMGTGAGIGDGKTAPTFSGTNSYILLGTSGFSLAWLAGPCDKGSAIAWGRVDSADRWTDATMYRYLFHVKSGVDTTVYCVFGRNQTNHQVFWRRRAAGAILEKTYTFSPAGPTTWFCQGFSWDRVADAVACYLFSANTFTTVYSGSFGGVGNGAWGAANNVEGANCVLGAGSATLQEWMGRIAHVAVWNAILTARQFQNIMIP